MWKWNPCWSFIKGLQLSKQQFYSKSLAPGLWENSKLEPGLRENSKTYWEEGCVEDDEVEGEGEEDGSAEVVVLPWGHSEKRLVFRHTEMLKLKVLNRWCFSSYNFRCCFGWGSKRNCTVCLRSIIYLLMALSISMVTRTERAMVIGWASPKISQSKPLYASLSGWQDIWWD